MRSSINSKIRLFPQLFMILVPKTASNGNNKGNKRGDFNLFLRMNPSLLIWKASEVKIRIMRLKVTSKGAKDNGFFITG
jgi:hypothetical protein